MMMFILIGGGVALILFGVRFLRKGLDRLLGAKLGQWMQRLARRRLTAFMTGMGMSLIAPSSTTMSVLAVQTVRQGLLGRRRMLAVVLGAEVGLTVMVLLIALRLDQFAPLLLLLGVPLFQFMQHAKARGVGQVMLALGFVLLGIGTIKQGAGMIEPEGDLVQIIRILERQGALLAIPAMLLAVLLQSATATIGLIVGLGGAGVVTLQTAVMVVVGANIGIGITTLIVGWSNLDARRLALGNLLAKLVTAVLWLLAAPWIVQLLEQLPGTTELRIAYAHTGFNITLAILALPLVENITRLTEQIAPVQSPEQQPFGPRFINQGAGDSLALALGQARHETLRVAEMVRCMLNDLWRALTLSNAAMAREVARRDNQVDQLDEAIKRFLYDQDWEQGREAEEPLRILRYLAELETIGDIIDKNLAELVIKKIRLNLQFSKDGWAELNQIKSLVAENMLIAEAALTSQDEHLARRLVLQKARLNRLARELRDRHFNRLNSGLDESRQTSAIHLDLITYLRHINSHLSHIAFAILNEPERSEAGEEAEKEPRE